MSASPDSPQWSGRRPFIGRDIILQELKDQLANALRSRGRGVILHGPPGSGRAALARRVAEAADGMGARIAIGNADDPDEPAWSQIAFQLTARRRAVRAILRSAKGWIGLLPLIGGVAEAVMETIQTIRGRTDAHDEELSHASGSTLAQIRLLLREAPTEPRLIILENLETGDPDEMAGAFALVRSIGATRTFFIGTSTSVGGSLPENVVRLRDEMIRCGTGDDLEIPALSPEEAVEAIEHATRAPAPPDWRDWLSQRAPDTPEALWTLLGELEHRGVVAPATDGTAHWIWTRSPEPGDDALVAMDLADADHLSPEERELLGLAAGQGAVFAVPSLADRLGLDELDLQERLDRLVRRGVLAFHGTTEDQGELTDHYAFPDARAAARWAARRDAENAEASRR